MNEWSLTFLGIINYYKYLHLVTGKIVYKF